MKMIWKDSLLFEDYTILEMPEGANVLSVQLQRNVPCLWYVCDNKKPTERRIFLMVGTGQEIVDDAIAFIDTFQVGSLVFHVFEVVR